PVVGAGKRLDVLDQDVQRLIGPRVVVESRESKPLPGRHLLQRDEIRQCSCGRHPPCHPAITVPPADDTFTHATVVRPVLAPPRDVEREHRYGALLTATPDLCGTTLPDVY